MSFIAVLNAAALWVMEACAHAGSLSFAVSINAAEQVPEPELGVFRKVQSMLKKDCGPSSSVGHQ